MRNCEDVLASEIVDEFVDLVAKFEGDDQQLSAFISGVCVALVAKLSRRFNFDDNDAINNIGNEAKQLMLSMLKEAALTQPPESGD